MFLFLLILIFIELGFLVVILCEILIYEFNLGKIFNLLNKLLDCLL